MSRRGREGKGKERKGWEGRSGEVKPQSKKFWLQPCD